MLLLCCVLLYSILLAPRVRVKVVCKDIDVSSPVLSLASRSSWTIPDLCCQVWYRVHMLIHSGSSSNYSPHTTCRRTKVKRGELITYKTQPSSHVLGGVTCMR